MPTIPVNITGGSYEHRSGALSAQVTRNFYPQRQDIGNERSPYTLEPWFGRILFADASGGVSRGIAVYASGLYHVCGGYLYHVSSAGVHTVIGAISGSNHCIFAETNDSLIITTGRTAYVYDGTTLSSIDDEDLETPNSCAYINTQVAYDGNDARFCVSDAGAPTTVNALNYATAEYKPDDLKRVFVHATELLLMGDETVERWRNTGTGSPPFDRLLGGGGVLERGLAAIHAVCQSAEGMYFLADDLNVYRYLNGGAQSITSKHTVALFSGFTVTDDARMWLINDEREDFLCLSFPAEKRLFVFATKSLVWFEWTQGNKDIAVNADGCVDCYGKRICAANDSGKLYTLSDDVYTDDGAAITRTRDTAPLHGGIFNAPGKEFQIERLVLNMQRGTGGLSGDSKNPQLIISCSRDGGKTFGTERRVLIGNAGDFDRTVELFNLGRFRSCVFRVRVSDPVYVSIHSADVDLEVVR